MKIAIGADNLAIGLKDELVEYLRTQSIVDVDVEDFGVFDETPMDYPDIAEKVADAMARGEYDRGILICGTGIGMAIAANKVPGIRAAQCHDVYSAERARKSNNAQILTMGAMIVGPAVAKKIIDAWLPSEFAHGRSEKKVNKIMAIEARHLKSR